MAVRYTDGGLHQHCGHREPAAAERIEKIARLLRTEIRKIEKMLRAA